MKHWRPPGMARDDNFEMARTPADATLLSTERRTTPSAELSAPVTVFADIADTFVGGFGGGMLKAQRREQFIDVCRGDQLVTSFDFVRRSPFSLDGQEYMAKATSVLGVSFSLYRGDEVIVVEKTTSLLTNAQQIEHDGRTWSMKPARYFGKTFNVLSDGGTKLGAIVPARYFFPLSDITIDLPDNVPTLVQVFMLWLAVRSWTTDTGGVT